MNKLSQTTENELRNTLSLYFENNMKTINNSSIILNAAWIETPIGVMIAISDEKSLYLLEFLLSKGLTKEINRLEQRGFTVIFGDSKPLTSIKNELNNYFAGCLKMFETSYHLLGSSFQQKAWRALCQIPFGETRSYSEQAILLGKPTAHRAVGTANGSNQLAIIIPCHRVIASNGALGGYDGGLAIKEWLLAHEKRYK